MAASRISNAKSTVAEPVVALNSRDIITKRRLLLTTGLTWQQWKEYYRRSKKEELQNRHLNGLSTSESELQFLNTPNNHDPVHAPKPITRLKSLPPASLPTCSKKETEGGETSRQGHEEQIKSDLDLSLPIDLPKKKKLKRKLKRYLNQPPVKKVKEDRTKGLILSLFGPDSESECTAKDSSPSRSTDANILDSNFSGGQSANFCQPKVLHHVTNSVNNSTNQKAMVLPKQADTSIESKNSISTKRDAYKKPRPLSMDSVNIPASHHKVIHQSRHFDKPCSQERHSKELSSCSTSFQTSDGKGKSNPDCNGDGAFKSLEDPLSLKNSSSTESAHSDEHKDRNSDNEFPESSTSPIVPHVRSDLQSALSPSSHGNDRLTLCTSAKEPASVRTFIYDYDKNNNDELCVSKDASMTSPLNRPLNSSSETVSDEEKQSSTRGKSSAKVTKTSVTSMNSIENSVVEVQSSKERQSVLENDEYYDEVSDVRQDLSRDSEESNCQRFQIKVRNPEEINRSFESGSFNGHLLQNVTDEFIISFHEDTFRPWSSEESTYSHYADYFFNIRKNANIVFNSQTVSRADQLKMINQIQTHALICRHLTRVFSPVENHERFSLYVLMYFLQVCKSVPVACGKPQLKLNCIRTCFLLSLRSKQVSPNGTVEKLRSIVGDVSFWESCQRIWRVLQVYETHRKSNGNSVIDSSIGDTTALWNVVSAEEASSVNKNLIAFVQDPLPVKSVSHDKNNSFDTRIVSNPCDGSIVNRDGSLQPSRLRRILSSLTPSTSACATMVQERGVSKKLNAHPHLAFVTASQVFPPDENTIAANTLTANQNGSVVKACQTAEYASPRNPTSTLSTSRLQPSQEFSSNLPVISGRENDIGNLNEGHALENGSLSSISLQAVSQTQEKQKQLKRIDFPGSEVGVNISVTYRNQQQVLGQGSSQPAVRAPLACSSALASANLCFQQSSFIATTLSHTRHSTENPEVNNPQVQAGISTGSCEVNQNHSNDGPLNSNCDYSGHSIQNQSTSIPQQLLNNNLCRSIGASPEVAFPSGLIAPNLNNQRVNGISQRDVPRQTDLHNSTLYYWFQHNTVIESHQRIQHRQQTTQQGRQETIHHSQHVEHTVQTSLPQQSTQQQFYVPQQVFVPMQLQNPPVFEHQSQPVNQPTLIRNSDPSAVFRALQESGTVMHSNNGFSNRVVAQTPSVVNQSSFCQNSEVAETRVVAKVKRLARSNQPTRKVQAASTSCLPTLQSLLRGETYRTGPCRRLSSETESTFEPPVSQHNRSNLQHGNVRNFGANVLKKSVHQSVPSRSSSANVEVNITNLHVDKVFTATDAEGNPISFHVKTPTIPESNSNKSTSETLKCSAEAPAYADNFVNKSAPSKDASSSFVSPVLSEGVSVNSNSAPKVPRRPRVKYTKCRSGVKNQTSSEISNPKNHDLERQPVVEPCNQEKDDSCPDLRIDLDTGENVEETNSVSFNLNRLQEKSIEASSNSPGRFVENPEILEILEQIPPDNFNKDLVLGIVKKKLGSAESLNGHQLVGNSLVTVTGSKPAEQVLPNELSTMSVSESVACEVSNPTNAVLENLELDSNHPQAQKVVLCVEDSIQHDKFCKATSSKETSHKVARHILPASIAKPASVFRNPESSGSNSSRKNFSQSKTGNSTVTNDAFSSSSKISSNNLKHAQQYTILNDPENICKLVFTAKNSTPEAKSAPGELRRATDSSNVRKNNSDVDPVVLDSINTHLHERPSAELEEALIEIYLERAECTESDRTISRESLREKTMDYFRQRSQGEICQLLNTRLNAAQKRKSEVEDSRKRKPTLVVGDAGKKAFMHEAEPDNQVNGSSSTTSSQLTPPPTPTDECSRRYCNKGLMDEKYPCDGCNKVVYCSESCKTQDFFENHCNECDRNVF